MVSDRSVQSRVAGKQAVELRTVWQLQLGHIVLRCIYRDRRKFVVQHRSPKGWSDLTTGEDPMGMLRRALQSDSLGGHCREAVQQIELLTREGQ